MKDKSGRDRATAKVVRLAHAAGLPLPDYQSAGAAGMDLMAAIDAGKPLRLTWGARALVPTGLILELPPGTEAQVRPRSGLALRQGITVLNSPGTIDEDYRGELKVLLINLGESPVEVVRGDRIAQLVVARVVRASLREARAAKTTRRGAGGFGSTGTNRNAAKKGSRASPGSRKRKTKSARKA